jgi:hypothetical protein
VEGVIAIMSTLVLTHGAGRVSLVRVGLLERGRWRGGYWRGGGGRGSLHPALACGEVWHSIFWVVFIKGCTLTDEGWAGGGRAWVGGAIATGDAFWCSAAGANSMELTGAVGAFFNARTHVVNMSIFLTFNTSDRDA